MMEEMKACNILYALRTQRVFLVVHLRLKHIQ